MRYGNHLFALAALAALAACQDSGTAANPEQPAVSGPVERYTTAGPSQTGWIVAFNGRPVAVTYELQHGRAIWQGDIDLGPIEGISASPEEAARRGKAAQGVAIDDHRWPGGVVPYVISPGLSNQGRVTDAISHIEGNNPGVDFVPRTTQADFVRFEQSTGCSSAVGRVGGMQYVRLGDGCTTGNVIHELLHALGMMHEQARCDRDAYVTINTANIEAGMEHNFSLTCAGFTDHYEYSERSIMHYPPTAFSRNGLPTIVSKRGLDGLMGQRSGMSATDVATVKLMYPFFDDTHEQGWGG